MEDEVKTAETNGEEKPVIDSDADVSQVETEVNEAEFSDTEEPLEAAAPTEPAPQKEEPKNTDYQNSENARRRRADEQEKALKAARVEATIEALNGKNPYTGEKMQDAADVEEYFTMRKIEQNGGDPVTDFPKYHKEQERKRAEEAAQKEKQDEWFKNDSKDFLAKHPDVSFDDLSKDKEFLSYAEGKIGVTPLAEIYEGYKAITASAEKRAQDKAKQALANAKATPGALRTPNAAVAKYFTKERVDKMSKEEVRQNYDDIRESIKRW